MQKGKTGNSTTFVIAITRVSFSKLKKVADPLGETLKFFISLAFEIQSSFDYLTSKIKFLSVGTSK